MALSAAVLGLSVATAAAVADPTDEPTPPSSETSEPATPPTETEPTESTDPSTPPPSSPSEEPTGEQPSDEPAGAEPEDKPGEETADEPSVKSIRDMQMTATFDKPSYNTGEKMSISVTLKNAGPDEQTVRGDFFSMNPDAVSVEFPNPFDAVTLAPGASVTHTIKGAVGNPATTTGKLIAWVYPTGGGDVKPFEFPVPIKQTTGHVSGTVYTDRNDNGKFDTGEGQSGVTLTFTNYLYYSYSQTATTNSAGGFSLTLPTGPFSVTGTGPDGLEVGYRRIDVDPSGTDDLLLRAVGPVTGLSVDLEFTKETYARDEAPTVRVTLTNDGDVPLHGIVAGCNRAGFDNELHGGDGWGDLSYGTDGVTIAAHSTKVLEVTEPMPSGAYDYGYVVVACDFGYEGASNPIANPGDFDMADVPGQRGDLGGIVADDGTGIGGARLVLVPQDDHCPVAEAVSDDDGTFAFEQVPVGNYDLYVIPPAGWHYEYDNPTPTNVVGSYPGQVYLELAPGDGPKLVLPTCVPGPVTPATPPAPAPQGRPAPAGLAETGASILVPGAIGLLAVLTGAGAVVVTRRRKAT